MDEGNEIDSDYVNQIEDAVKHIEEEVKSDMNDRDEHDEKKFRKDGDAMKVWLAVISPHAYYVQKENARDIVYNDIIYAIQTKMTGMTDDKLKKLIASSLDLDPTSPHPNASKYYSSAKTTGTGLDAQIDRICNLLD